METFNISLHVYLVQFVLFSVCIIIYMGSGHKHNTSYCSVIVLSMNLYMHLI